jgi:magnesium-transporting ATPase (P-type)
MHLPDHPALAACLRAGILCNEAQLVREEGRIQVQGDPTEAALLVAAGKAGLIRTELQRASPVLDSMPFESGQMFRATLHETHPGRVIYKVGALERLLECSTEALGAQNSVIQLDRDAVRHAAETMASRGLRVLALARRPVAATLAKLEPALVTEGFTFLGLQAMMDPPRAAVIASVEHCQRAGIAVKMITGDHVVTARAIAGKIGLQGRRQHGQLVALSGRELEKIPDGELPEVAERTAVFARVAPEQKLRIVRALQARGHVVAMTGDGVNDAPALKQADIGIAMGRGGTDVAKGAAAMILTDDNFASIEAAVEEGRGVFDNLTKFITWIIPTNLGEALILLAAIMLGLPLPLLALQLLWINLTDTLLGLSLAFEPRERDVMSRPPRPPQEPLLTLKLIMRSALVSFIMVGGGLGLFLGELHRAPAGLAVARTVAVNTIVLVQLVYLFNCRSLRHSAFSLGWFTNRWVIFGSLAMLAGQLLFTYAPVMNRLFHSAPIDAGAWLRIAAVAALAFVAVECEKWLRYGRRRGDQPMDPTPRAPGALPADLSNPGRAGKHPMVTGGRAA